MTVEQIFNKKKFDMIDDATIQKYKNICLQQLRKIQEQEEKAKQEMQKQEELIKKQKALNLKIVKNWQIKESFKILKLKKEK